MKRQSEAERFSGALGFLVPSPYVLPINQALSYYDIAHCSFETWLTERSTSFAEADDEDISDYYEELRLEGPMEDLLDKVVDEVFFVLFGNRRVLLWFNDMMAKQISDLDMESVEAENMCFLSDRACSEECGPRNGSSAQFSSVIAVAASYDAGIFRVSCRFMLMSTMTMSFPFQQEASMT